MGREQTLDLFTCSTRSLINRDDPEIDLPFLSFPIAMRAIRTRGGFIDLTPEQIPNLKDVAPILPAFP